MRTQRPIIRPLWAANPGAHRAYLTITTMTLAEGVSLIAFSPERTSGPAYRVINQSGGPGWVGILLLGLAVLLVAALWISPRATRYVLVAGSAAHVLICFSFAASAVADPHGGPLAPVYTAAIAFWFISQSELYRVARAPAQ